MDPAKRLELYREVHRIFSRGNPPADFLWGADQYWAVAKRVENVEVSPMGLFHFCRDRSAGGRRQAASVGRMPAPFGTPRPRPLAFSRAVLR
jgi:hypothetical protein